jgi:ATP-binding cassette subfamily B protein
MFADIDRLLAVHLPAWRMRFAAIVALAASEAATVVLRPLPIKALVDPIPVEGWFARLPEITGIRWFWLCIIAIVAIEAVLLSLRIVIELRLSVFVEQLTRSIRRAVARRLLRGPYAEVSRLSSGAALSSISADTTVLVGLLREGMIQASVALLQLSLVLAVIFFTDRLLFALLATQIALVGIGIAVYSAIRRRQYFVKLQIETRLISLLTGLQQKLLDIRFSPLRAMFASQIGGQLRRFFRVHVSLWRVHGAYNGLVDFTTGIASALCLVTLIVTSEGEGLPVGKFLLFLYYTVLIFPNLNTIGNAWPRMVDCRVAMGRLGPATGLGSVDSRNFIPAAAARWGAIRFENVSLAGEEGKTLIDRLDFTIEPGERFCLAGDSGTGKTTVLMLMLGLTRPSSGRVTIDGVDVTTLPLAARKRFFLLSRAGPTFIPGSVLDNIALHRAIDDASLQEIIERSRLATRLPLVKLRGGEPEMIGERGEPYSGGEQQRIAASRWFSADTPCLILDEALNSLDEAGELAITRTLIDELRDKTLIVISHRRSATFLFGRKLVMLGGGRWRLEYSGTVVPATPTAEL